MQVYLVGGAVRDSLMQLPIKDKDWVVVGATPEQMLKQGFRPVGKDFPVFLHPTSNEEYALARTERKTGHGYTGFNFYTAPDISLEQDLLRRDLTINAIAVEIDTHGQWHFIDPFNGRQDIANKILRHVSPAFSEDPLRVLRVARFLARFSDFKVAAETTVLIKNMVNNGEVGFLVAERTWAELAKGLSCMAPWRMFDYLHQLGALAYIWPELATIYPQRQQTLRQILELSQQQQLDLTIKASLVVYLAIEPCQQSSTKPKTVLPQLRLPKDIVKLALAIKQLTNYCQQINFSQPQASEIMQLYCLADGLRQPQFFSRLMLAVRCLWQVTNQQLLNSHIFSQLENILAAIIRLDLAPIIKQAQQQNLPGKQLGMLIAKRRLEHIDQLIQQII